MRKITSLTLVVTGLIEFITSVVLYILPAGRVAYWSDYQFFGLSKTEWGNIHITVGTLFAVMAGIHIYLNWHPITAYLKNRVKEFTIFTKSFTIALLLSLYVTIGTLYGLPPMNSIIQLGEYLTESANEKYGEPPYGHAELSSLQMFCSRMNLDLAQVIALLKGNDITMKGPEQPIGEMAKNNGLTSQKLYSMIKKAEIVQAGEGGAFPEIPYPGFGQKTIKDICQAYNLPLAKVLAGLQDAGFTAQADGTVKTVSSSKGGNPMEVFEIIREIAR